MLVSMLDHLPTAVTNRMLSKDGQRALRIATGRAPMMERLSVQVGQLGKGAVWAFITALVGAEAAVFGLGIDILKGMGARNADATRSLAINTLWHFRWISNPKEAAAAAVTDEMKNNFYKSLGSALKLGSVIVPLVTGVNYLALNYRVQILPR